MLVIIFATLIGGGFLIFWLWSPPSYRYAKRNGLPATATVLTAEKTGWRSRQVIFTQPRSALQQVADEVTGNWQGRRRVTKWEYKMNVQVAHPRSMPYEVMVTAFLEHPPRMNAPLAVKIHPDKPKVVVVDETALV
jgi:hypothetical protein